MRYVVVFILVTIISFALYVAMYLGVFKSVDISHTQKGPFFMIYKNHTGPYHKIVSTIEEVEKWASENHVPCSTTFGEYLDDPGKVEQERLRSRGGCIVDKFPPQIPAKFGTHVAPEKEYVVAIFKGSPGIGPLKVYPKVNQFLKENNLSHEGSIIELYEIYDSQSKTAMTTTYLF